MYGLFFIAIRCKKKATTELWTFTFLLEHLDKTFVDVKRNALIYIQELVYLKKCANQSYLLFNSLIRLHCELPYVSLFELNHQMSLLALICIV